MKPYIISEDVEILMKRWAEKSDYTCPGHDFFLALQRHLVGYMKTLFSEVIFLQAHELRRRSGYGIVEDNGSIVVSLDQVNEKAISHLQSNRVADIHSAEIIGEAQRPGYPDLLEQIKSLPRDMSLILDDDGCFSGETIKRIYEMIIEQEFFVQRVQVGILIDRSRNCLSMAHPEVTLSSVFEYDQVVDWICERDFFIGAPLSGRTAGKTINGSVKPVFPETSLPYCLPFANPFKCASIPLCQAGAFSRFVISLSCLMWEEVERVSGRDIPNKEIPRLPRGIQRDGRRFVEALADVSSELEMDYLLTHV